MHLSHLKLNYTRGQRQEVEYLVYANVGNHLRARGAVGVLLDARCEEAAELQNVRHVLRGADARREFLLAVGARSEAGLDLRL